MKILIPILLLLTSCSKLMIEPEGETFAADDITVWTYDTTYSGCQTFVYSSWSRYLDGELYQTGDGMEIIGEPCDTDVTPND